VSVKRRGGSRRVRGVGGWEGSAMSRRWGERGGEDIERWDVKAACEAGLGYDGLYIHLATHTFV
jgi:hypothetical protein